MDASFISRRPIFDRHTRVAYYDLVQAGRQKDSNAARVATLAELGVDSLSRGRPALIALNPRTTAGSLPKWPFGANETIGVSCPVTEAAIQDFGADVIPYVDEAAFLCLDTLVSNETLKVARSHARMVRLDAEALGPAGIEDQVEKLRGSPLEIVVKGIQSADEFEFYRALGVDYFKGPFLANPRLITTPAVAAGQASVLKLLAALHSDAETDELREIVVRDVSLSYKLLRYINSAYFSVPRRFSTVRSAIIYLGREPLRQWASLILLASLDSAPEELRRQALVRARLCEQVAASAGDAPTGAYFTTGLFSTLDALLDMPMDEVLATLPLHETLVAALTDGRGRLGEALACALDHEVGRWRADRYLGLGADVLTRTYAETVEWADGVMALFAER